MTKIKINEESTAPEAEVGAETQENGDSTAARIVDLEKQLADMKERALREMADAENTRRRAQKEKEETSKYAVGNFAKEMLAISDNFQRALSAVPTENLDPATKNLMAGVDATERQLQAVFERFGIKKIEPVGKPFDPNFHQVMTEIETPDQPAGTVVKVLQTGYMIHDRLLREALVAVAKSGQPSAHVNESA